MIVHLISNAMERIKKETTIEEILEKFPVAVKIFMDFRIPCLVCGEALWGNVEEAAEKYKVNLDDLLAKLNRTVQENW